LPAMTGGSAKRYAEAVFGIAESHNSFGRWSQDLAAIAHVQEDADLNRLLSSPAVELTVKEAILAKALPQLSPEATNLVKLLLRKGRLSLATQIAGNYRRMLNDYRGIAVASVASAVPLNKSELEAVARRLSVMTGRQVQVEPTVDPSIMGGIVARIGDQLIDASVKGRLEALKKRLAAQ
jgi:F-type H+-transporting ATPase subunit delta